MNSECSTGVSWNFVKNNSITGQEIKLLVLNKFNEKFRKAKRNQNKKNTRQACLIIYKGVPFKYFAT